MFVNVDICKIVFTTSESTYYELPTVIFIELLNFYCEVLTMCMSGDVSGAQLAGRKIFWKLKNCPHNGKKYLDCVHPWIKWSSMLSFKMLL